MNFDDIPPIYSTHTTLCSLYNKIVIPLAKLSKRKKRVKLVKIKEKKGDVEKIQAF